MGVTAIKYIQNNSTLWVTIMNRENGRMVTVQPKAPGGCDIWIPWATNSDEYGLHHLELRVPLPSPGVGRNYYIWQCADTDGDLVRYNTTDGYKVRATPVPGWPMVDGDRILIVNADGSFSFQKPGVGY